MKQLFSRRAFTTAHIRVVKQKVPNPNVTPHNPEHRPGYFNSFIKPQL